MERSNATAYLATMVGSRYCHRSPPSFSQRERLAPAVGCPKGCRQKSVTNLTPGRVAQSMGGVLAVIGTPSHPPKPRGKSPEWSTGQPRRRKIRCPIVKKGTTRPKKQHSKLA